MCEGREKTPESHGVGGKSKRQEGGGDVDVTLAATAYHVGYGVAGATARLVATCYVATASY
jgi:hypothetical protein